MACFIKWRQSRIRPLKQNWMEQCLESLRAATEHDPNDHLVHFYLSLTYALCRKIDQALLEVRIALRMHGEHLPSIVLLALLLSTPHACSSLSTDEESCSNSNECQGSLFLIEATLEEYPHNFDLLYVKALLEEKCHGGEVALATAKEMLALWKLLYEDSSNDNSVNLTLNQSGFETRSLAISAKSTQPLSNEITERENGNSNLSIIILDYLLCNPRL